MLFDPDVWGPHYWFFLHTVSRTYPEYPNDVTKRKYYDLIQNMPLFLPDIEMGNNFASYLDKYPVTPYLDNRDSFIRWMIFIHNKMNNLLGKEEFSIPVANDLYLAEYKPKPIYLSDMIRVRKHYLYIALILICFFLIYVFYS